MSKVLTNNQYYSQIANVIREQNGTSNTYTPPQMVRALKDLFYEEVEGVPPIIFQGIGENLLDYRIDGASGGVGDRTSNLFDYKTWKNSITGVSNSGNIIFNSDNSFTLISNNINDVYATGYNNYKLPVKAETNYYFNFSSNNTNAGLIYIFENGSNDTAHRHIAFNQSGKYVSFTTQPDATYIIIRFGVNAANSEITYKNISLVEGNSAPSNYDPYGYKVPLKIEGKNLLQNTASSQTVNGVTFTVNENKSVTCNGKNQNENQALFVTIGDYSATNDIILSGGASGGNLSSYILRAYTLTDSPIVYYDYGNGVTLPAGNDYRIQIRIAGDYTCNNLTFYPMIRLASIQDDTYEPYHEPTTTNIYIDEPIEAKANIPSEYTEVEYLESTGTQYIDTGFVPNSNSGFKTKIVFTGYTTGIDDFLIGLRSNNYTYGRFAYTCTGITFYCSFGSTTSSSYKYDAKMPRTEIIECELNYKNSNTTITQGVEGLIPDKNEFNGEGLTFYLAGAYNAKGIPKYRATRQYKCELTQGTEVVRDLVPCYRKSDNVAGLYDLVNNTFYTNQGTGNFIVGPIKENESISLSDTNVNIPTIRGTNVLTVDTTVQPSNVYIKSRHESSYETAMRQRYEEAQAQLDALESGGE